MKSTDILIVGGSAAGVAAAVTARRFHPEADITLIRKEEQVHRPRVYLDTPVTDSWSGRRVQDEQAEKGAIG